MPTGLGKTFIAANVILNYYKWFPTGKIFFLAPTRPLVNQQKEALECIRCIDAGQLCQLNGQTVAKKRGKIYNEKRVFFMTPQILNNDLEDGVIDPKSIVLLIFGSQFFLSLANLTLFFPKMRLIKVWETLRMRI